ncbi:hypothetical protein FNV43_RR22299 [Rhamnella rubrinervis]|uniref:Uncharacterized protein n=1 Tax=Rhamnella rubrinervis TaxID=2594499 RepID=A0A8K0DPY4_9ROSA|nr:hypothetical protein FNV43_RR22299 [Rhamnella rubrinervis]
MAKTTTDDHDHDGDHHTSDNSVKDGYEELANSMEAKLYDDSPPLSSKCCIFRVPEVIRRSNQKDYEPDIVSIGPFHRKKKKLQPMEKVKRWYLRTLLSRVNISMLSLIKGTAVIESRARECYQEPIEVNDEKNEFLEMMIMDGCFLIELFRKEACPNLRSLDDPIFNMACMHQYIYHDLLLLENQLPLFVLQNLFYLTMQKSQRNHSLNQLVLFFFSVHFAMVSIYEYSHLFEYEHLHVLDLIRNMLIGSYPYKPPNCACKKVNIPKLIPCVTHLLEAGVKFKKGSADNMMNINFVNGVIEIPPLIIEETTEPMFRNMIAYEQCFHRCFDKVTSYAVLMDNLINSSKDVEHLSDCGIIDNWLSAEKASMLFNNLYNDTLVTNFYYATLCGRVNKYYMTKWHRWRATLMRDYFKTPWTIISTVGAFILLVLTFLQTFYSIMQPHASDDKQCPANCTRLL